MEQTITSNSLNVNKKYFEYFIPAILSVMSSNIASIVDTILAGNLIGKDALSTVSLFAPIQQLVFTATIFLGMGASTVISISRSKNDKKASNQVFTLSVMLIILVGVTAMSLMYAFGGNICSMMAGSTGLDSYVSGYYGPYVLGVPLNIALGSFIYYIRIDGRPKFTTVIVLVSNIVNLTMDYILMGVLKVGIAGASTATDIGLLVATMLIISHYVTKKNTVHIDFSVFKNMKEALSHLKEILTLGLSGALSTTLTSVKQMAFNAMIISIAGSAGLMSMSVCSSSNIFVSMFITGASQAMMPIIGIFRGEQDYKNVRATFNRALKLLIISGIVVSALVLLIPEQIALLFGVKETAGIESTVIALRFNAISFIPTAVVSLIMYFYTATSKKGVASTIAVISNFVTAIPCAYILSRAIGINGIWLSFAVSGIITLAFIYIISLILCKNSKGKYKDFYLIEERAEGELFSLTVNATKENAVAVSQYLSQMLLIHCKNKITVNRVATVAEEVIIDITNRTEQNIPVDLRVCLCGDNTIMIIIRDNGKPHDITKNTPASDGLIKELELIKSLAKSVEYSNLLGFNRLILKINNN